MTELESERKKLVEALFNNKILNENKWKEISLPIRHGGLGINVSSLTEDSNTQLRKCEVVTEDLKSKLLNQDYTLPMKHDLKDLKKLPEKSYKTKTQELGETESEVAQKQRMVELSSKCTNSWLHAMPISAQRRYLSKNEFQDALSLRFGMKIKGVALKCACGDTNTTIHANNCKVGGYVTRRHDVMRNFLQ